MWYFVTMCKAEICYRTATGWVTDPVRALFFVTEDEANMFRLSQSGSTDNWELKNGFHNMG